MAEYCEKCLIEIEGLSPEQARKEVKTYKPGEKDLCEGCGEIIEMRIKKGSQLRLERKALQLTEEGAKPAFDREGEGLWKTVYLIKTHAVLV